MSNSVDTKVVEMKFENQEFEKRVSTSLSTIENLKKALNFDKASEQIAALKTNLSQRVSFDGFANAIDGISDRFSTLGIVGATVISNLTSSFMNSAKKILTAVPNMISEGGLARALNIEQARFQLEGLGVAWKDIIGDIEYGVKSTAYGLDSAAKVAAQLVASDVQLGEQMQHSLRAVSGVAAMTNRTYDEIGYIFTSVAGLGKVQQMQLRQLALHGLNASAYLVKYFNEVNSGTAKASEEVSSEIKSFTKGLQVTSADIDSFTKKGVISYNTFAEAMDWAFGEHAKDANKTFTGALSNVKAALSRIGADVKASRLENLRKIFVNLIPVIDKIHKQLKGVITGINGASKAVTSKLISAIKFLNTKEGTRWINTLIKGFSNLTKVIVGIGKPIKSAFLEVFGLGDKVVENIEKTVSKGGKAIYSGLTAVTKSTKLVDSLKSIRQFLSSLFDKIKIGEPLINSLNSLFKGLFIIAKNLGVIFKAIFNLVSSGSPIFRKFFDTLVNGIDKFGQFLQSLDGFGPVIADFINALTSISGPAFSKLSKIFDTLNEAVINCFAPLIEWITGFKSSIKSVSAPLESVKNMFASLEPIVLFITRAIGDLFKKIIDGLKEIGTFENLPVKLFSGIATVLTALVTGKLLTILFDFKNDLNDFTKQFTNIFGNIFGPAVDAFTGFVSTVNSALQELQKNLKAKTIVSIAIAIAILAGSLLLLSMIDSEKVDSASAALFMLVTDLSASMFAISKMASGFSTMSFVPLLISMAAAVFILAGALKKLSDIDQSGLDKGLVAISSMLVAIGGFLSFTNFQKIGVTVGPSLMMMAAAISMLTDAVKDFGGMEIEVLYKGIASITGILMSFALFSQIANPKGILRSSASLILMATALRMLTSTIQELGSTDLKVLGIGIGACAVSIAAFGAAMHLIPKGAVFKATSIIIAAGAMKLMADALYKVGGLSWESLKKAMIGLIGCLVSMSVAIKIAEHELAGAAGIATMASTLIMIAQALQEFASLGWNELAVGLAGMAGSLLILGAACKLMEGSVGGALSLTVLSFALMSLAGAVTIFAQLNLKQVGIGLAALAGALLVMVGAAALAGLVVPGMLALAAALFSFGLAMVEIGAAAFLFATAIAMIASLGVTLDNVVNGIPNLMEIIKVAIIAFLDMLDETIPPLLDFLFTTLDLLLVALEEQIPSIVDHLFVMLDILFQALADGIEQHGDQILDSIVNVLVKILELLLKKLVELGKWLWEKGKELGSKLLEGIKELKDSIVDWFKEKFEAIKEFFTGITEAFWNDGKGIGTSLLDGIKELKDNILDWLKEKFEAIKEFFTGIAVAFWNNGKGIGSKLLEGIQELKDNILNWFKEKFEAIKTFFTNIAEAFWNDGKGIGTKLLEGIKELKDGILNWFKEKIQAVKDWFSNLWGDFRDAGANLIDGLVSGLESVPVIGSVIKLGRNIKNAFNNSVEVHSPSKATERTGKYFVQGFIVGVNKNSKQAEATVENFGLKLCQKVVLGLEKGKSQIRQSLKGIISIFDINGTIIKFASTTLKDTQKELDKILKSTAKSFKTQKGIIDEYLKDFTKYKTQYKTTYSGLVDQNGIGDIVAKKIKIPKEQTKIFKNTAKLVGNFAISLYKASEAYATAVHNVRAYNAALQDEREQLKKLKKERPELTEKLEKQNKKLNKLEKERKKLEKERKKLEKENTAESKKKIKEIDKEIKKKDEAISKEEKRIQKTTDALNNNKKATKDTVDTIKALNKALKQELKDISKGPKEALKEYKKTLKEMVKSSTDLLNLAVTNHVNLFEQYEQNEAISAETLLNNMQSQILGVNQWQRDIDRLTKKGLDKGLIERLREMGPEGAKYVQAFLSMTNEEIKKANLMYKAEGQLVGEQLLDDAKAKMNAIKQWSNNITALAQRGLSYDILKDLVDQGYDNAEYVQALVNMTDEQLREMSSLYVKEDKLPTTIANNIAAALSYALNQVGENVLPAMGGIDPVTSVILNSMKDSQNELTTASTEVVTALADGIADSAQVMLDATRLIGDTTVNTFREYFNTDNGTTIGVEITAGIVTGLITGKDAVAAAAEELAQTIDDTVSDELEIHSPSKKMITIGKFINEGLASGLKKYSALVVKSATEVGTSTKNTIADTINAISSFFDHDFNQPVIRPTLDLSDISKNANRIDNMFNSGVSLFGQTGENGEIQNGKVFNFTQNNYSPKALPRIEIYRQTRNQFSALKGLV